MGRDYRRTGLQAGLNYRLSTADYRLLTGAVGRTRTGMGYPIRPSNVRVYQFHHDGTIVYLEGFPAGAFAGGGAGCPGAAGAALPASEPGAAWAGAAAAGAAPAGAGAGAAGFGKTPVAVTFCGVPFTTDGFCLACTSVRPRESTMNPMNAPVVNLWSSVVAPRAPKAV